MRSLVKRKFIPAVVLFDLFVLFTISLRYVDVRPLGPLGSLVGYGGLNKAFHEFFGVHMALYVISDWAGVAAIALAFCFAVVGLVQWLKRKSIKKVDQCILALGGFYILVFAAYAFFEFCVVNYRPVLINGILEASYPSSTTMLASCVFPSAMMVFRRLIGNLKTRFFINFLCLLLTVFMLILRILSGVHWITDIFGGILFSVSAFLLLSFAMSAITCNKE